MFFHLGSAGPQCRGQVLQGGEDAVAGAWRHEVHEVTTEHKISMWRHIIEDMVTQELKLMRRRRWWSNQNWTDAVSRNTFLVLVWVEPTQKWTSNKTRRLMISYTHTHSNNVAKRVLHKLLTSSIQSHAYKSEATQPHARSPCAKRERKVTDTLRATKASQAHTAESQ